MTDREALLAAVATNPADDLPRLVLADHLDEFPGSADCPACGGLGERGTGYGGFGTNPCTDCSGTGRVSDGSEVRAELIRVQVELARTPAFVHSECKVCGASPDYEGWVQHGRGCYQLDPEGGGEETADPDPRHESLAARERELLARVPALPGGLAGIYRRGMLAEVRGRMGALLANLPSVLSAEPVAEMVKVADRWPDVAAGQSYFAWDFEMTGIEPRPHDLPVEVWRMLLPEPPARHDGQPDMGVFGVYPSADAANAALSDALLKWARAQKLSTKSQNDVSAECPIRHTVRG